MDRHASVSAIESPREPGHPGWHMEVGALGGRGADGGALGSGGGGGGGRGGGGDGGGSRPAVPQYAAL